MNDEECVAERETWEPFLRHVKTDPLGLFLFVLYILAAGFYIYVRCAYSLNDLGSLLWYAACHTHSATCVPLVYGQMNDHLQL